MVVQAVHNWAQQTSKYSPIPYIPNVSVGWDSTPRYFSQEISQQNEREVQSDRHENLGYPYLPVAIDNTPYEFAAALASVSEFLLNQNTSQLNLFIINSWNEVLEFY